MYKELTFCFDIDGTICPIKRKDQEYIDLIPFPEMVSKIREYKEGGAKIVLFTSRNMNSYDGNIGMINANTAKVLLAWLEKEYIPYDEIINGKPWPGHKGFYGPQGIGVLITNNVKVNPIITGGTGTYSESITQPTSSPEGLESGTLSMPCILGLKAGVKYVVKNFNKINTKIEKLTTIFYNYLKSNNKIKLYSFNPKSGVMSFNIIGSTSSDIGDYLSEKYNICVRTGLHCAPLIHKENSTLDTGMVRVSISSFNKVSEIKKLIKAIENFNT